MNSARYVETMLCWCKDADCRFYPGFDAQGNKRIRPIDYECPSKPEDTRIGRKPVRLYQSAVLMDDDPAPHVERVIDEMLPGKNEMGEAIEIPHPRYGEKTFFTPEQLAEMDAMKAQREETAAAIA